MITPTEVPPVFRTADPLGSSAEGRGEMAGKYKTFTPEFRGGRQDGDRDITAIADVAREYGVNETTVGNWVRAYRESTGKPNSRWTFRSGRGCGRWSVNPRAGNEVRVPDKSSGVLCSGASVTGKYKFIDAEYAAAAADTATTAPTIRQMCEWLEVSKSGFYEWRNNPGSATAKRRKDLKLIITRAFDDSDGTSGYRRVHAQLQRWGVPCGDELVRALMRELGLVPCQVRPRRSLTVQAAAGPIPDLVDRDFGPRPPARKWSAITLIRLSSRLCAVRQRERGYSLVLAGFGARRRWS